MGTILKYLFYIAVIIVVFLLGKGIYDGQITRDSTVAEVGTNIADGTGQLIDDTRRAINKEKDQIRRDRTEENTDSTPNAPEQS